MNVRRVRFTAIAERQFENERVWWRKNRDNKEVFEIALEHTLARIATHPETGAACRRPIPRGLRRCYVTKIACHLYYTSDEHTVMVRALWGARRARGPWI